MSKELKLEVDPPTPPVPVRSLVDILNDDHVGVEFYVHHPRSTAPWFYSLFGSREEADEDAARSPGATVFVRDVSEWRPTPIHIERTTN